MTPLLTKQQCEELFERDFLEDLLYHNLHTGLKMTLLDTESFISKIRHQDLEAVLAEVEGMKKVVDYQIYSDPSNTIGTTSIGNNPKFTSKPLTPEHYPYEYGYNQAITDLKAFLSVSLEKL